MPEEITRTVTDERGRSLTFTYDSAQGDPSADDIEEMFAAKYGDALPARPAPVATPNPTAPTRANAARLNPAAKPGSVASHAFPMEQVFPQNSIYTDRESDLRGGGYGASAAPTRLGNYADSTGINDHRVLEMRRLGLIAPNAGRVAGSIDPVTGMQTLAARNTQDAYDTANNRTSLGSDDFRETAKLGAYGTAGLVAGVPITGFLGNVAPPLVAQIGGNLVPALGQAGLQYTESQAEKDTEGRFRQRQPFLAESTANFGGPVISTAPLVDSLAERGVMAGIQGAISTGLGTMNDIATGRPVTPQSIASHFAPGAYYGALGGGHDIEGYRNPFATEKTPEPIYTFKEYQEKSGAKETGQPEQEARRTYGEYAAGNLDVDAWNRFRDPSQPEVTREVLAQYLSQLPEDASPLVAPVFVGRGRNAAGQEVNIYDVAKRADGTMLSAYGEGELPTGYTKNLEILPEQEPARTRQDFTNVYKAIAQAQEAKPASAPELAGPALSGESGAIVGQTKVPEYAQRLQGAGYSPVYDFNSLTATIKQAAPHLSDEAAYNQALLVESLRKGSAEQLGTDPSRWYRENLPTIIKGTEERAQQIADDFNQKLITRGEKPNAAADQFQGVTQGVPADYPLSPEDAQKVVTLFPASNESTLPHEVGGHIFLGMLEREATANNPVATRDLAAIKEWAGVETLADAQETFAIAFEKWLKDGVAPNASLQGVFQRFSNWLKGIYESTITVFGGKKESYDLLSENKSFDGAMKETVSRYFGDISNITKRGSEINATDIRSNDARWTPPNIQGADRGVAGEAGGGTVRGNTGTVGGGSTQGSGFGATSGRPSQPGAGTEPATGTQAGRSLDPDDPRNYQIETSDEPLYQWYKGLRTPWSSEKTEGVAKLDSAFEAVRAAMLDEDPDVLSWERNFAKIPYTDPTTGKERNYFPDFLIRSKSGKVYVEEVKPLDRVTNEVVQAKAKAASEYFGKDGIGYTFVTEADLPGSRITKAREQIRNKTPQKEDGSANFQRIVNGKPAATAPPEPPTIQENLSSLYKAGLLSNPTTHAKNILGNTGMQASEEIARIPAAMADIARTAAARAAGGNDTTLGSILGTHRTTAGADIGAVIRASREAATTGIKEATELIKTGQVKNDRFTAPVDLQNDLGVNREFATKNPILNGMVRTIFRGLSAQDRIFKVYSWRRSIEAQASVIARAEAQAAKEAGSAMTAADIAARQKSLVEKPTDQMAIQAIEDAEFQTFNGRSFVGDLFKNARRSAANPDPKTGKPRNPFRAASFDALFPFTSTPANVTERILEYTLGTAIAPIKAGAKIITDNAAAAKGIEERVFDDRARRQFAQTFGRGVTGATLIALGYAMADRGQLTGSNAGNSDYQKREKSGIPESSIHVGDNWYRIDFAAPVGSLLLMGATIREQEAKEKGDASMNALNAAGAAVSLGAGSIPVADGVPLIQSAKQGDFAGAIANQTTAGIPSAVKTVARALDGERKRDTSQHFFDPLIGSTPGLRGTLPEKKSRYGKTPHRNPFSVLDPFQTREGGKSNPNVFKPKYKQRPFGSN